MASALRYLETLLNTRLDDITAAIGSNGKLRIYSGTQPTHVADALSGNTLLADLALSATAAAGAASHVLTLSTITADSSADATGTATFGFLTKSDNTRIVDFSVSTASADLNLNTVSIVSGAQVSVSSFTITAANY